MPVFLTSSGWSALCSCFSRIELFYRSQEFLEGAYVVTCISIIYL